MKINLTNIFLGILIVLLLVVGYKVLFGEQKYPDPAPITITIPAKEGGTGLQVLETVRTVPVYLPSSPETPVDIDSEWKRKYDETKDSLDRQNLYYKAIKINKYERQSILNDSTIEIFGSATTRGTLLDYAVDYRVKPSTTTYTPIVEVRRPRLQAEYGVGVFITPAMTYTPLELGLREGKYGIGLRAHYDPLTKAMGVSLNKTFTLIK